MDDERAASPVIGIILLVAVAVIIGATVFVFALTFAEDTESPPKHAIEYETYDEDHGVVVGTYLGGDSLDPERLSVTGTAVDLGFTGRDRSAGDTVFHYARPGDTVRLVWTKRDESAVVDTYTVPEDASLEHVDWDGSTAGVAGFESQFWDHNDNVGGVRWAEGSDHIRATAKGSQSWALYSRTVPKNDGEITVDLHLETRSFGASGYKILVRDAGGDRHVLWCEDNSSFNLNCPTGTTINGSQSKTVSADEEIGSLQILIVMGNGGTDEALLYELQARD